MGLFKRRDPQPEMPETPTAAPSAPTAPPAGAPGGIDLDAMRRQGEALSASVRQKGFDRGNLADLKAYAQNAQAQGLQQMQAVQQVQSSGGGVGALMSALGMDYSSDYVKRVDCPSCGGPKKLASPSAYVYCDYCGALADYDFRRAVSTTESAMPGPEYAQLVNGMQPQLKAAKQAGDKEAYRAAQHQIFEAYAQACPGALSHRISDPDYRAKLIDYMAESRVATEFDPEFAALDEEMRAKVGALEWTGDLMARRAGGPSFRALVDVCERQAKRSNAVIVAAGLVDRDPDRAGETVRDRMHHSLFSQGWLPMLEADDAAWLVDELGLRGEYTKLEEPYDIQKRNCGGCGQTITALPGSKTVVCSGCGKMVDVGGAQSPCGNCGGALSFPVGTSQLQCPYCHSDTERVGWT